MNTPPPWLAQFQFALLDSMSEGVNLATTDGELIYVNAACERMFGYGPGELVGWHFAVLCAETPATRASIVEAIWKRLTQDRQWTGELPARRRDGTPFYVHARITLVTLGGDDYLLCVQEDITRRKQAEQALSITQTRLEQIIDSDILGFIVWDKSGAILEANDMFLATVGYTREDLVAGRLRWTGLTPAEYRERDEAALRQLQQTGRCEPFEKEYIRKDGSRVPILIGATILDANVGRGVSFTLDLSQRKKAEQRAQASEQRFQAFMDNTQAVAFMKDEQGRYIYINRSFREQYVDDDSQWYGKTDHELWPGERAQQFIDNDRRVLDADRPLELHEWTTDEQGRQRHWQVFKFPFRDVSGKRYLGGMAIEITDQRKAEEKLEMAEEQVRHSQKMEAVGRLAGGVAHDFNNLLTIINGCSELLLEQLAQTHPGHTLARDIHDAGERAAALTRQLLAFSRRQMLQPKVLDVNKVLLHLDKILRRAIGADVEIAMVLAAESASVRADPAQLDQAIINLGMNARDAMPAGGKLVLETSTVSITERDAKITDGCTPGRYVRIVIHDTGHGMDETTLARIFEPFFTTKQPGHGTGLGLAMVYGFVRQSGGQVTVESEPGEGTRFIIDLPCAEEPKDCETPPSGRAELPRGSETVLVVDDEDGVRAWTRHVLESCGYRVLEASHGAEAIAVAEAEADIDLVVTDVIMPKMTGGQVAEALVARYPELKVLYVSGYTDDAIVRRGILTATAAFLQKPFSAHVLATKVRELLDQTSAVAG